MAPTRGRSWQVTVDFFDVPEHRWWSLDSSCALAKSLGDESGKARIAGMPQPMQKGWPAGSAYTWWPSSEDRSGAAWSRRAPRFATLSSSTSRLIDMKIEVDLLLLAPLGHSGGTWSGASCHPMLHPAASTQWKKSVVPDDVSDRGLPEPALGHHVGGVEHSGVRTISISGQLREVRRVAPETLSGIPDRRL